MRRQLLSDEELKIKITFMKGWKLSGKTMVKELTFQNFTEAIEFIQKLVEPSEKINHHPTVLINYNQVVITLTTHDRNGLTEYDFQLAKLIDDIK